MSIDVAVNDNSPGKFSFVTCHNLAEVQRVIDRTKFRFVDFGCGTMEKRFYNHREAECFAMGWFAACNVNDALLSR